MGLFDRLRRQDADHDVTEDPTVDPLPPAGDDAEAVDEVGTRPLTPDEQAGLDAHRARYADLGIDPADVGSVAAAYDRAVEGADGGGSSSDVVPVIATAIGDHLVAAGGYRWVVSTDPFGTDLAVEPPRKGVPVVTGTLVAVRWMQRERGWLVGVTEHLARAGRR